MDYVLWGRNPHEPEWQEEVLFETKTTKELNEAFEHYKSMGFVGLRVLNIDGSKPDFTGTINF